MHSYPNVPGVANVTTTAPLGGLTFCVGIGVGLSPPIGWSGWLVNEPANVTFEPAFTFTQRFVYCAGAGSMGNVMSAPGKAVKSPPPAPAVLSKSACVHRTGTTVLASAVSGFELSTGEAASTGSGAAASPVTPVLAVGLSSLHA